MKIPKNVIEFTESTATDKEMITEEIWSSKAHCIMLLRQGIIEKEDAKRILLGLRRLEEDYREGRFRLRDDLEDVHMNVEHYITKISGEDSGGKLHTARSRNDQVLTDTKLYLRSKVLEIIELLIGLERTILKIAKENTETVMPGYTHMQHAQPITLGFWATAYVGMFLRDLERLKRLYKTVNRNPLGACALAGTSFPIDRKLTSELLGFDEIHEHALDAVSSRDFIIETMSTLAILMSDLSRLAEDIILFGSYEFRMIRIPDEYSTGSSIMPQKRNPDIAELLRGRTGRIYGTLMQILTTVKGLPSGYNRDFQEDKPLLFDSLRTVGLSLSVIDGMMGNIEFDKERMSKLLDENFSTATELANFLVREKNLPFRKSHQIVKRLVREVERKGKNLNSVDAVKILDRIGIHTSINEINNILDPEIVVRSYKSLGGTSPVQVKRMIKRFESGICKIEEEMQKNKAKIKNAQKLTERMVKEIIT